MDSVRISVRELVEFVLRSGDIDSRYTDASLMLDGTKAHRKIQKAQREAYAEAAFYEWEVPLRLNAEAGGIPLILQGRADGVINGLDGSLTVDEIKTTTLPLEKFKEQRDYHLGQAKCYAHMLLQTMPNPPDEVNIQLTYYHLETEKMEQHHSVFTANELADFFNELMQKYGEWLNLTREWHELRDHSIRELGFPFEYYRKGQREMVVAVYRTIERERKLYVQAPTGIGKTLSVLFPSVKALGEGKTSKLFYLTAKTVTRGVVEDTVNLMQAKGLRLKTVTLRAKDKICFCAQVECNPDYCPFARGHYDRVNQALLDMLRECDLMSSEVIMEYAWNYQVCPYEFMLDLTLWADLVIGDYNHVFDPTVYLRRFFQEVKGGYVFLIDEAHNLADRVRNMYTVTLRKSDFSRLKKELKERNHIARRLQETADELNQYLILVRSEYQAQSEDVNEEVDFELNELAGYFCRAAEEWLKQEKNSAHPLNNDILALYFNVSNFLKIAELYDEHYVTITEVFAHDVLITLFCLDPSAIIAEKLRLANSSVLFSATLTPLAYYRDILGGAKEDELLSLASPFDPGRLLLIAHHGISTKYKDRPHSLFSIAEAIYTVTSKKRGNYLVFFPSYEYLRKVHEVFSEWYSAVAVTVQQSPMAEAERTQFLEQFTTDQKDTLLGFCVLGGIFAEGIDLKGERLIGSIIVGVGLPKLSLRQDLIRDYFDRKNGEGYDYAYVFPGMNKVLQAAGRVIRTESDYGVVLLIDSRFYTSKYRRLYPASWAKLKMIRNSRELNYLLARFPYF